MYTSPSPRVTLGFLSGWSSNTIWLGRFAVDVLSSIVDEVQPGTLKKEAKYHKYQLHILASYKLHIGK